VDEIIPIDRFELFASGLDHPECIAFDRDGFLWAGGEAGQIYRVDPAGHVRMIANLGSFNAGLAFSPKDELFVCNPSSGIIRVGRDGTHEVFATHAGDHKIVCANFPVFDAAGNLYVTDSGQWKKNTGRLTRFTPDGRGVLLTDPMGYLNGLALTADQKYLYMVESDFDRVWRIEVDAEGAADEPHLFAENVGRLPDGLALDAAGNLYVACYASDEIHRITPAGDRFLFAHDRWAILLSRPTNIAFGGDNFADMYVANLGRQTISRAKAIVSGQPLANLQRN
jgi:gluconolactonase